MTPGSRMAGVAAFQPTPAHGGGLPACGRRAGSTALVLAAVLACAPHASAAGVESAARVVGTASGRAAGTIGAAAENLGTVAGQLTSSGSTGAADRYTGALPELRRRVYAGDVLGAADGLSQLGVESREQGDYAAARLLTGWALLFEERVLGPDHPKLARDLAEQALEMYLSGDSIGAVDPALRAERLAQEQLRLTAQALTEREALKYAATRPTCADLLMTLAAISPEAGFAAHVWDAAIHGRALVLDELANRHRAALLSDTPELALLNDSLAAARGGLARLTLNGAGPNGDYVASLDSARAECQRLERSLALGSRLFRAAYDREQAGFDAISEALGEGDAIVATVRYRHLRRVWHPADPRSRSTTRTAQASEPAGRIAVDAGAEGSGATAGASPAAGDRAHRDLPGYATLDTSERYVAFVLTRGSAEPIVAPLGDAGEIDALATRWRERAGAAAESGNLADEAACELAGDGLRAAVWDPIAPMLSGARRVFLVPDGALQLVNFEALPLDGSRYLVDLDVLLQSLSSERDLARTPVTPGRGMVAVGSPDFDAVVTDSAALGGPDTASAHAPAKLGTPACATFRDLRFEPLPAAAAEAADVRAVWAAVAPDSQSVMLVGGDATEAALHRAVAGVRAVHIATHAFFLDPACADSSADSTSVTGPLLLSGIGLAGSNRRIRAGGGLLTAEEIGTFDLTGAELVVLSSCNTALGIVRPGEGVFGLRRALSVAGARTLVMSLWPVEDATTRGWAVAMYRAWLGEHTSVAEAVRSASRALLRSLRDQGGSTSPAHWAAFVATGAGS